MQSAKPAVKEGEAEAFELPSIFEDLPVSPYEYAFAETGLICLFGTFRTWNFVSLRNRC